MTRVRPVGPIDVSVVTYDSARWLPALVESLLAQTTGTAHVALLVRDNASRDGTPELLDRLTTRLASRFLRVEVDAGDANLGFGAGHNRNAARGRAPLLLVLNPDAELEPDALACLAEEVEPSGDDVAAFELRQVPYEHPKVYDPRTGETGWCSGAALLLRRSAFDAVGGFDERIFLYGEDVDLSFRLRDAGYRLRYAPRAVVRHHTYAAPGQVKPQQWLGSTLANLYLRVRFGTWRQVAAGVARYVVLFFRPTRFPGQRAGLLRNLTRFIRDVPYFRRGRRARRLVPAFNGWDYGPMREGAFYPVRPSSSRTATPLVSVLVRTAGRPAVLREALLSVARQTYPAVEVVVVEDGPPAAEPMVRGEFAGLRLVYRATGSRAGRCAAGNLALSLATGEYLTFLDDDDLLYADHVEVLLDALRTAGTRVAYALAVEVPTAVESIDPFRYVEREADAQVVHRQPFSRALLWHHNYMPIQSVLFHRSLYEELGGFDETLENLEDWNLWTRYSLAHDFAYVPKTTSRYRVPACAGDQARRSAAMDRYRETALRRLEDMRLVLSPADVLRCHEEIARSFYIIRVSRADLRRSVTRWLGERPYAALRDAWRRAGRALRPRAEASLRSPLGEPR